MKFRSWLLSAVALGVPGLAYAQEAGIDDIVVTAEKRATNLQDTPLPVQALPPEMLTKAGITQIDQLDKILPDVQANTFLGSLNVVLIRGVQSGSYAPDQESTTAIHLDGAMLTRTPSINGHFYDLERVEVLKGPQGTLYGRAATGGALNIITKKPELGRLGGYAQVEAGNFNNQRFEGALNLPLGEKWAARAAYRSSTKDGYYTDTGYGDEDNRSMRFSLRGEPTERLKLQFTADREVNQGVGLSGVPAQPVGGFGAFTLTNPEQPWRNADLYNYRSSASIDTETWGFMAQADYDLGFATLTGQYSNRGLDDNELVPNAPLFLLTPPGPPGTATSGTLTTFAALPCAAGCSIPGAFVGNATPGQPYGPNGAGYFSSFNDQAESYEVRLVSNPGGKLDWILGANLLDERIWWFAQARFFANNFVNPQNIESRAAYGQFTYSPIDPLHLTIGARYTEDEKSSRVDGVGGIGNITDPATDGINTFFTSKTWNKVTWKANASYDLTKDNMIYAQASTGIKGGSITGVRTFADPEMLLAYELGSKNRFFDQRLQVNVEAYYYDYMKYQSFAGVQVCRVKATPTTCVDVDGNGLIEAGFDTTTINATINPGGTIQYGSSVSAVWEATDKDSFRVNVSWQHNHYDKYDTRAATLAIYPDAQFLTNAGNLTGAEFGPAPWSANASYSHVFDLGTAGELEGTLDAYYTGQAIDVVMRRNEAQQYILPGRDAYTLFDVSARYTPKDGDWFIQGYVRNLFDDDSLATKNYTDLQNNVQFAGPRSGYITGNYVEPRTFGVVFGANF